VSWQQYHDILKQAAAEAEYYDSRPPEACPLCGEPLTSGPPGSEDTLRCRYDGWAFPRDA
jgi:hypothetical protein